MIREDLNISAIEDKVIEVFGVAREGFYTRQGVKQVYTARHYLWLILHDIYGMSHKEIAVHYDRSRRMVAKFVSKMRFRVENQREDRALYDELKKHL